MDQPKYHKLSLHQGADGKVMVAVDILGPIIDPLAGLSFMERARLVIRPYSRSERALMRAVKPLPAIARRAVVADILAARRHQAEAARQKRAERDLVDQWITQTIAKGNAPVRLALPVTTVPGVVPNASTPPNMSNPDPEPFMA